MSSYLDDLLNDLGKPENENTDEVAAEIEEVEDHNDEVEETTETDEGVSEEIADAEETTEASEETEAEEDDDTELTPVERKAWGRLKALQDERTKRQSVEAERDRLSKQLADMQRQQQESAAQNLPDPYDDPEGYRSAIENHFRVEMTKQQLGFSIQNAVAKYGETEVETAAKWFEDQMAANPHMPLRDNMLSQADQMEYVVNSYKQAQKVSALANGDYSVLIAELQKAGYSINKADTSTGAAPAVPVTQTAAATTATAKTVPAAPKRSKLANATGATTAPSDNGSFLDAVLRR